MPCAAVSSFTSSTDTACAQTSITLTNTSTGATTYNWLDNGTSFSTATSPTYSTSVPGVHFISLIATEGSCFDTSQVALVIHALPTVFFPDPNDVCANSDPVVLPAASPAGGVYSGTEVAANTFAPIPAGVGTFPLYYTYTDTNGCAGVDSTTITVQPIPTVTFTAPGSLCEDAASITMTGSSPTPGTYFGPGISNGDFLPSLAGPGTHTITYVYTSAFGCSASDTDQITVFGLPNVTLNALSSICADEAAFTLQGGSPAGGTYSGVGVSGGQFDPVQSGPGVHAITYTLTDPNGCTASDVGNQVVNSLPSVFFAQPNQLCIDDVPITLSGGFPAGGTYSGNGVAGPFFSPTISGSGGHNITYLYTAPNGCKDSAMATMNVFPLPNLFFAPPADLCIDSGPVALNGGFPVGGQYSGTAVADTFFFPNVSGPGQQQIDYTYTDAFGCTNTTSVSVEVFDLPQVSLIQLPEFCADAAPLELFGGTPFGGTYSGPGVSNDSLDISLLGAGTFTIGYSYTDANGCSSSDNSLLTVNPLPTPGLGPDTAVCAVPPLGITPGFGFDAYNWSTGPTTPLFLVPADGNYAVTVTDENLCLGSDTINVIFFPPPTISLGPDELTLEIDSWSFDAGFGWTSYLWNTGSTNRSVPADTTGTYWVEVTDSNGCVASDTIRFTIWPTGIADLHVETQLKAFPNPASEQLTLQAEASNTAEMTVALYSMEGKVLLSERWFIQAGNNQKMLAVDALPAGTYVLRVGEGQMGSSQLIQIQH